MCGRHPECCALTAVHAPLYRRRMAPGRRAARAASASTPTLTAARRRPPSASRCRTWAARAAVRTHAHARKLARIRRTMRRRRGASPALGVALLRTRHFACMAPSRDAYLNPNHDPVFSPQAPGRAPIPPNPNPQNPNPKTSTPNHNPVHRRLLGGLPQGGARHVQSPAEQRVLEGRPPAHALPDLPVSHLGPAPPSCSTLVLLLLL